jgi:hypothetical protein
MVNQVQRALGVCHCKPVHHASTLCSAWNAFFILNLLLGDLTPAAAARRALRLSGGPGRKSQQVSVQVHVGEQLYNVLVLTDVVDVVCHTSLIRQPGVCGTCVRNLRTRCSAN